MNCAKIYRGILTQTGANPPQEQNSRTQFNKPITWARTANGVFVGTCPDGWIKEKTHVLCHGSSGGSALIVSAIITADDEVTLYFDNEDAANLVNLQIVYFM